MRAQRVCNRACKSLELFWLDTPSLATFRVGLGGLISLDVFVRWLQAETWYSDLGVLPLSVLKALHPSSWSLFDVSGASWWATVLLGVHLAAAIAFCIGWRPRWCAAVLLFLGASLHGRNPWVTYGVHEVMQALLLWSFFVPLKGQTISTPLGSLDNRIRGIAPLALLAQLSLIYGTAALHKLASPAWRTGEALADILRGGPDVASPGLFLGQHGFLCALLGWGTIAWELAVAALVLMPWSRARYAAAGLAVAFHLGTAVTMNLGFFPWVLSVAWLAVLPSERLLPVVRWLPGLQRDATRPPPWLQVVAGAMLGVMMWACLQTLPWWPVSIPSLGHGVSAVFAVDQQWSMFSGDDYSHSVYHLALADLEDDTVADLYGRQRVDGFQQARSERNLPELHRAWLINIGLDEAAPRRTSYVRWWCAQRVFGEAPERVRLYRLIEELPEPGQPFPPASAVLIEDVRCGGNAVGTPAE